MLTRLDLRGVADDDLRRRLPRPASSGPGPVDAVRDILAQVRERGDAAVRDLTERFDGVAVDHLRVPQTDLEAALESTPPALREALEAARDAVAAFHRHQVRVDERVERDGVVVRELRRPVDRAGIYAPGGRARYPSTVLMCAVPARVAGVGELVLCVPPEADGRVAAPTLAAAALAGVDEVYRCGGAQAVAAMAYGTESVRPVDVIVGPGNVYVALAKRELAASGLVGIPSAFAGPSEVVVVADETTPVELAAIDVVVQAEHGPDGLAWLVTWSDEVASTVTEAVTRIVARSPRRADLEATLAGGGYAAIVDGPEQALAVANAIAPEHLELMCDGAEDLLPLVRHAGAVFCGPSAPASVGDYIAGPSHVLPTNGSARFSSGLRVDDFVRHIHAVTLDAAALARVAPHVAALAEAEGLTAHAESVLVRGAAAPRAV
ncbi:MAG TPA: histidinol dehydrogenase [Acidimicrobiales bacterium]|nr:histidinol dehydrogenase [Acidimicrobiales bacterium]